MHVCTLAEQTHTHWTCGLGWQPCWIWGEIWFHQLKGHNILSWKWHLKLYFTLFGPKTGTKQHWKTLKKWFPTKFGMAILVVEADLTENSKWPPDMSTVSTFFTCFNFGTEQRKIKLEVSFPTKCVMAFLFMESDLTSDSRWLQSTMSNFQTWSG